MILALALAGNALAQDAPVAEEAAPEAPPPPQPRAIELMERDPSAEPHPKHIILPDPVEPEAEKAEAKTSRPVVAKPGPTVPPRIARKVPRTVSGGSPAYLHGRYSVVEVTEGGMTEDYGNKMERAGRALDEDCIVTHTRFDFGELPDGVGERHRPRTVAITRIQECTVGGLGKYAEVLTMVLDVTYTEGDDDVLLTLPAAKVVSDYVRLVKPDEGDMPTPPQWLAPATTIDQTVQRWFLKAEPARRGALPVLHLISEHGAVWHLEPDRGDSPFDIADRAAAGLAGEAP